jgi:hypothetical protein
VPAGVGLGIRPCRHYTRGVITVRSLLLAGAAAVLLLLAGCPQGPGPYANYAGVNLIADQAVFGFPVPLKWVPDATNTYVNFEFVSLLPGDLPTGAPTGAQVWRLEIKNLVPNGDFEVGAVGFPPAGWALIDVMNPGNAELRLTNTPPEALDGMTLYLKCVDKDPLFVLPPDMVDFDVRAAAVDGFLQDNTYLVRFDYRTNKDRLVFEYNNLPVLPLPEGAWTWNVDGDAGPTFTGRYTFPPANIVPTVTVGPAAQQHYTYNSLLLSAVHKVEAYIDNFRLIRTNETYFARMSVADGEAALPLVPGTYRFSIWVKLDPTATPVMFNRFASHAVELSLKRTYQSSAGEVSTLTSVKSFHDGVGGFDLSGGSWQQVSVELPGREWQTPGATVSMEIGISPTDETLGAASMDCGSVLIAAPSLELCPDTF